MLLVERGGGRPGFHCRIDHVRHVAGSSIETSLPPMHYNAGAQHAIYFMIPRTLPAGGDTPGSRPAVPYPTNRGDLLDSSPAGRVASANHQILFCPIQGLPEGQQYAR
jgi:hypothetical protein